MLKSNCKVYLKAGSIADASTFLRFGKSFLNKEKQIWVIREKKIKAKRNNKKRPCLIQRKSEN